MPSNDNIAEYGGGWFFGRIRPQLGANSGWLIGLDYAEYMGSNPTASIDSLVNLGCPYHTTLMRDGPRKSDAILNHIVNVKN